MNIGSKVQSQSVFSGLMMLIFCVAACFSSGYGFGETDVLRDILVGTLGTFLLLLAIAWYSPRWATRILLFYVLTQTLYFPIGYLYGAPTFKIIGSLMETDQQEAIEFLCAIPSKIWLLQIIFGLFGRWVWHLSSAVFTPIHLLRNNNMRGKKGKWANYLLGILFILLLVPPIGSFISGTGFQDDETAIPVTLIGFYVDALAAPSIYIHKKAQLEQQAKMPATWHIQAVEPRYKNYVLVIGESARRDYMNAYGFPLPDTPFLSKTKGLLIDGYVSAAENTMMSLPPTLSEQGKLQNNIISLAKQAGFSTAWLSNQGMMGFFAATISRIAIRSDYVYFTQRGDYQKSVSISDAKLLPELHKVLKRTSHQPRLIVLHLMGSHPDFCKRVGGSTPWHYQNKSLSCYVETIAQTDDLLAKIVAMLQEQAEPYSLIYFSDHGLKHVGTGAERTMTHGGDTFESFAVPFVKISSDDTEHRVIKTQRNAFHFLQGFSQWTGIRVQELPLDKDFFGDVPDSPDEAHLQKVNRLAHDAVAMP